MKNCCCCGLLALPVTRPFSTSRSFSLLTFLRRGTSGNTWRNYGKRGSELPYYEGWWRPRADILDEAGNIRIEFELPGRRKEDKGGDE